MATGRSRTRLNRVVPNWGCGHGPSSSVAGRRSSHFFKIILPSTVVDKKLRIPEKFVREFGDELSTVATLTVPSGHMWQVGLEKANKRIWFHEGWHDFMESHYIHLGHLLVFRYEGNSNFHVLLFDKTATEIHYPSSESSKLEDQANTVELEAEERARYDKLNKTETSNSRVEVFATYEDGGEMYARERFPGTHRKGRLPNRAIQEAIMFNPKGPSFMGILWPYNMLNNSMYVPVGFAVSYLRPNQFVKPQTSDGKQWDVKCRYRDHLGSAMRHGQGWRTFRRDNNNLGKGDVCVFELIDRKPVVLKVSIFRVTSVTGLN